MAAKQKNDGAKSLQVIDNGAPSDRKKKKHKKGGAGKIIAIFIILLLLLIGALIAAIVLNLFGIRDKYFADIISKIPIVNNIIMPNEDEIEQEYTYDDLISQIASLNRQIGEKDTEIEDLQQRNDLYLEEIRSLRNLENDVNLYNLWRDETNREVMLDNPQRFQEFIENLRPDEVRELYSEASGLNNSDREAVAYINKIRGMNARNSAAMLETMITTNMDLIVRIMNRLDVETAAAIFNQMTAENAAAVVRQMEPSGL